MHSLSVFSEYPMISWAASMFLWTSVLYFIARSAEHLFKSKIRPSIRMALYAAVFVRLGLPSDWASPLAHVFPSWVNSVPFSTELPPATEAMGNLALVEAPVPELLGSLKRSHEFSEQGLIGLSTTSSIDSITWMTFIYSIGLLFLVGRWGLGYHRLRIVRRQCTSAPKSISELVPEYRVLQHEFHGPFAYGIFDPIIVVPKHFSQSLSRDAIRSILAHESAHHHRRDPLLLSVMNLVCVMLWPIAPLWLASRRIRSLIEQAADDHAMQRATPSERKRYAQLLLNMIDIQPETRSAVASLSLGAYSDLRSRILAVRRTFRWPAWIQCMIVSSVIAISVACSGSGGEEETNPEEAESDKSSHQKSTIQPRMGDLTAEAHMQHASDSHHRYLQSRAMEDADVARHHYTQFLRLFPDHSKAHEMSFYFAELEWAVASNIKEDHSSTPSANQSAFAVAHQRFIDAIDRYPHSEHHEESLFAQLLAQKNAMGHDETKPLIPESETNQTVDKPYEVIPYDESIRTLIKSYDLFLENTGLHNEDVILGLYHRAKIAMEHNHFDEAEPFLRRLLSLDSHSQVAVWASEMLLDRLTIAWSNAVPDSPAKLWAGESLNNFCRDVQNSELWQQQSAAKLRQAVPRLLAGLAWDHAIRLQNSGDSLGCGQAFESMLGSPTIEPSSPATILWNAVQCYHAAGEIDKSRHLAEQLLRDYPQHPFNNAAQKLLNNLEGISN